jgi:hypothetical protein
MKKNIINKEFIWLILILLSFAYELPIITISSYDRLNPRIFDFLAIFGIMYFYPKRFLNLKSEETYLKIWVLLILWFTICAFIWVLFFLPKELGQYSIYRIIKYIESLMVLLIISKLDINKPQKKIIIYTMILAGIFTSFFALLEHLGLINMEKYYIGTGFLMGPYSESYFQIGQYLPLFFSFTYYEFIFSKRNIKDILLLANIGLIIYILLNVGSRTGIGYLILIILVSPIITKGKRKKCLVFIIFVIVFISLAALNHLINLKELKIVSRIEMLEMNKRYEEDSMKERMLYPFKFRVSEYQAGWKLLIIGAGFYVSARDVGLGYYFPRIDYGYHSIYLFPLEQSGVIGFTLFTIFIVLVFRYFMIKHKTYVGIDYELLLAVFAYYIAMLIIGIGGHNFWQGFASGNVNTLILISIILAFKKSVYANKIAYKEEK